MQKLLAHDRSETTLEHARFLHIRLGSHPELAPLATDLKAEIQHAKELIEQWQDARTTRVAATAELGYFDGLVDSIMGELARSIRIPTAGRTDHPLWTKLFSTPPSEAMRPITDPAQRRYVMTVVTTLRTDTAYAEFTSFADRLEAAQAKLDEALATREELYVPESRARAAMDTAIEQLKRSYNLTHARLTLQYPDDEALVESFFLRRTRRGEGE